MKDFYYILGTDEKSTTLEIKEAYRKLSKKFHPDLNFNDKYFERHFREIKEAYETLSDSAKRTIYDKKLSKFKAEPSYSQYAEDLKCREDELRQREEKIRFRQAYPHYYRSKKTSVKDEGAPSIPFARPRVRKLDLGFTLVLVIITLIFGDYVLRVIHDEKQPVELTKPAIIADDVPLQPAVHHKRKHKLKAASADTPISIAANKNKPTVKVVADDYKSSVAENRAEEKAQEQAKKIPVIVDQDNEPPATADNTTDPPVAVNYKITAPKNNFLYATNIISNVTGVTNLRKFDRYNSIVIKELPSNSRVLVIQKGDVFYKILCDNYMGYVPKWSLETK